MADRLLIESNGSTLEKFFIWQSLLLESGQTYKRMSCCASAEWKSSKGRTRNMKKAIIRALSWHPMFPRWDLSSQAKVTWNECYALQMRNRFLSSGNDSTTIWKSVCIQMCRHQDTSQSSIPKNPDFSISFLSKLYLPTMQDRKTILNTGYISKWLWWNGGDDWALPNGQTLC